MFYLLVFLIVGFGLVAFGNKKFIKIIGLSTVLGGILLFIILTIAIPNNKSKNRTLYRKAYLNNLSVYETIDDEEILITSIDDIVDEKNVSIKIVYYETNAKGNRTQFNNDYIVLRKYYDLNGNINETLEKIFEYKVNKEDYQYSYIEFEKFETDAVETWFKFVVPNAGNYSKWTVTLEEDVTIKPDDYIDTEEEDDTEPVNPGIWY